MCRLDARVLTPWETSCRRNRSPGSPPLAGSILVESRRCSRRARRSAADTPHAASLRPLIDHQHGGFDDEDRRRTLAFDSLEGKVLLSTGMADPAATVHRAKVKHFLLNGTLQGIPYGSVHKVGSRSRPFPSRADQIHGEGRRFTRPGRSAHRPGKKPDLSNATLTLSNREGASS